MQDAFALALRKRQSFERQGSLEAWLWRVVVRSSHNTRRKRVDTPFASVPEVTVPDAFALPGPEGRVRAAIAGLSKRQREVVFLRYYADFDYPTIARVLRVRVGTVSATLNQAHDALRTALTGVTSDD